MKGETIQDQLIGLITIVYGNSSFTLKERFVSYKAAAVKGNGWLGHLCLTDNCELLLECLIV